MLKVRLQRVGRKNDPSFRVVVMDSKKDSQSGKVIEVLGAYDARGKMGERATINAERAKYWISVGAQPSDTVHNLLVDAKVVTGEKIKALPKPKAGATMEGAVAAETALP